MGIKTISKALPFGMLLIPNLKAQSQKINGSLYSFAILIKISLNFL